MLTLIKVTAAAVVAVIILAGCANMSKWFETNRTALEFAVKASVIQLIAEEKVNRERVLELAESAEKYVAANPEARANEIVEKVRAEIDWSKLTPGQTTLAVMLLDVVEAKIQERIEDNMVQEGTKARVLEVIDWIRQAAIMA